MDRQEGLALPRGLIRPGQEASPAREAQELYAPPRILDDPPVVDVFEGVTGHLLLVGAASAVLIAA